MTFIFHTVTYVTYMSRGAKVSCHYYKSNYPKFIGCKMHQCKTSNSLCVHHWLLVCFQSPRYKGNLIEIDKYFSCSHTDKIIFIFFISLATWPGVTTEVAGGQWPWFTAECYRAAAGWRGLPGSPGQPACSQRGEYKYVSTVFFGVWWSVFLWAVWWPALGWQGNKIFANCNHIYRDILESVK